MSKTLVISAIALEGGGTLSILQDCLRELSSPLYDAMDIYVLIKDKDLAGGRYERFKYIELNGARSYLHKLYYEYFYFKKLSKKIKPDLWLSLHDVTPNVVARHQVVYCHNPGPFYKISLREFILDPKFGMFTWFYWLVYRKNIRRNSWVIVQQNWIREEFARMYGINKKKIIVARPNVFFTPGEVRRRQEKTIFIYPAYPRVFKNIERIGEAVRILHARKIVDFEVVLTVDGTENGYARWLRMKYGNLHGMSWIGRQQRQEVYRRYENSDCLIFPSKLETWGLPISEFQLTGNAVLVADLPYARETVGGYNKAVYFDPLSNEDLADKMEQIISGTVRFADPSDAMKTEEPKAIGWSELFRLIL